MMFVHTKL